MQRVIQLGLSPRVWPVTRGETGWPKHLWTGHVPAPPVCGRRPCVLEEALQQSQPPQGPLDVAQAHLLPLLLYLHVDGSGSLSLSPPLRWGQQQLHRKMMVEASGKGA